MIKPTSPIIKTPKNRFFITHREASSLCLKSLLNENDGKIIVPKDKILGNSKSIFDLCIKLIKIFNLKFKVTKKKINLNGFSIFFENRKIVGQKSFEALFEKDEKIYFSKKDKSVFTVELKNTINLKKIFNIEKFKDIQEVVNFFKKNILNYKPLKSKIKISKNR